MLKKILIVILYAIYFTVSTILFRNLGKMENSSKVLPILGTYFASIMVSLFFHNPKRIKFNKHIMITGFLLLVQNIIIWNYMTKLNLIYANGCLNSRHIFLFIFSIFILKKKFIPIQYFGQLIIFIGIIMPNVYSLFKNDLIKNEEFDRIAALWVIFSALIRSISTVYFEVNVKHDLKDIWSYVFDYSLHCIVLGIPTLFLEYCIFKPSYGMFLKNYKFYITVFSDVLGSLGVSYLSINFCPIRRSIITNLISIFSSVIASLMPNETFIVMNLIALVIIYGGCALYEYKNIRKIFLSRRQ